MQVQAAKMYFRVKVKVSRLVMLNGFSLSITGSLLLIHSKSMNSFVHSYAVKIFFFRTQRRGRPFQRCVGETLSIWPVELAVYKHCISGIAPLCSVC